jgi:hypothetical protein
LATALGVLVLVVLTAFVGVAFGPSAAAASLPGGSYLLVGGDNGSMSFVNRATGVNAAQVPINGTAFPIAAGPGNRSVFTTSLDGIPVIDPSNLTVTTTLARPNPVSAPYANFALSGDRSTLFALDRNNVLIDVFNATTPAFVKSISVPGVPGQGTGTLAVSQNGSVVYAAPGTSNVISVVDVASGTVATTVTVPNQVEQLVLVGTTLYALLQTADRSQAFVSVIDTTTGTVTATWPANTGFVTGMAVAAGGPIYLTNVSGSLIALDATFGTVVKNTALGAGPLGPPVVTANGATLYIPVLAQQQVLAVTIPSLAVTTISTPYYQNALALMDYEPLTDPGPGPTTTTTSSTTTSTTTTSAPPTSTTTAPPSTTTTTGPNPTTATTSTSTSSTSAAVSPSSTNPPTAVYAATPLASTGSNAGTVLAAAGGLLVAGAALVMIAARSRRRSPQA